MSLSASAFDPPAPSQQVRMEFNVDELFAYLKSLAGHVKEQTAAATAALDEVRALRKEFDGLSHTVHERGIQQTVSLESMRQAIDTMANRAEMRSATGQLQRQIETVARMLELPVDEGTGMVMPGNMPSPRQIVATPHRPGAAATGGAAHLVSVATSPLHSGLTSPILDMSPGLASEARAGRVPLREGAAGSHQRPLLEPRPVVPATTTTSGRGVPTTTTANPTQTNPTATSATTTAASDDTDAMMEVPSGGGKTSSGGIRIVIAKELQEWYRTRGLVDAKIRHEITANTMRAVMAEQETRVLEEVRAMVADLVTVPFFKASQEQLQSEAVRNTAAVSNEVDKVRKGQSLFQAHMRTAMLQNVRRVTKSAARADRRISRFYNMMALPEPVGGSDEESGGEDEPEFDFSSTAAGLGATSSSPSQQQEDWPHHHQHQHAESGGMPTSQHGPPRGSTVSSTGTLPMGMSANSGRSPFGGPLAAGTDYTTDHANNDTTDRTAQILGVPIARREKKKRAAMQHLVGGGGGGAGGGDATGAEEGVDARTLAVIRSPVFVAFRQRVLNDISDRIAAARSTQSSDIDLELLAMRNDIRQRVTSSRVVELIKQYMDTETPNRVNALVRRVAELGDEKVSVPDLNDGLRSKADVHILDTKASVTYVDRLHGEAADRLDVLHGDVTLLIADRREYREMVQQLMVQMQRIQSGHLPLGGGALALSSGGGSVGVGGIGPSSSRSLPPISTADHHGSAKGRCGGGGGATPDLSRDSTRPDGDGTGTITTITSADGGAARRRHGESAVGNAAPRPLTELLSPRVAGGAAAGAVLHAPAPPLPMLFKPPMPGDLLPVAMTTSQEPYARYAGGGGGTMISSSSAAAAGAATVLSAYPSSAGAGVAGTPVTGLHPSSSGSSHHTAAGMTLQQQQQQPQQGGFVYYNDAAATPSGHLPPSQRDDAEAKVPLPYKPQPPTTTAE